MRYQNLRLITWGKWVTPQLSVSHKSVTHYNSTSASRAQVPFQCKYHFSAPRRAQLFQRTISSSYDGINRLDCTKCMQNEVNFRNFPSCHPSSQFSLRGDTLLSTPHHRAAASSPRGGGRLTASPTHTPVAFGDHKNPATLQDSNYSSFSPILPNGHLLQEL